MAWAFPAYSIVVTGDFMAMGRFLVPGLAFYVILLAWLLEDLWRAKTLGHTAATALASATILIGLLPGWDYHLVPARVREQFRFRFNTERFESEFEQWESQVRNVATWSARGRALKSYIAQRGFTGPQPSYVAGAIGATGYYSDVYIYDRHGLVTPEVARREVPPDATPHSPGHDKEVPTAYFLKHKPTIMMAVVAQHADAGVIADICSQWADRLRSGLPDLRLDRLYVTDVARVPSEDEAEPRYIITWVRIPEGTKPRQAWNDFERRLDTLWGREHLAPPP